MAWIKFLNTMRKRDVIVLFFFCVKGSLELCIMHPFEACVHTWMRITIWVKGIAQSASSSSTSTSLLHSPLLLPDTRKSPSLYAHSIHSYILCCRFGACTRIRRKRSQHYAVAHYATPLIRIRILFGYLYDRYQCWVLRSCSHFRWYVWMTEWF